MPPGVAPATTTCITGGQIIDPAHKTVTRADIVIEDERIARIGPGAGASCAGRTVNISGKFVMPGLIDLHVHLAGIHPHRSRGRDPGIEATTQLVMRTGLSTCSISWRSERPGPLRDKLRTSHRHASLHFAAPVFLNGRLCSLSVMCGSKSASKRRGVPTSSRSSPLRSRHCRRHLRIDQAWAAHDCPYQHLGGSARIAVAAGVTAITHLQDEVVIPDDVVQLMVAHNTRFVPTMSMQCDLARYSKTRALWKIRCSSRCPRRRCASNTGSDRSLRRKPSAGCGGRRRTASPKTFKSLRKLRDAHLTILAGSGHRQPLHVSGLLHPSRMELFAEAGIPGLGRLAGRDDQGGGVSRRAVGVGRAAGELAGARCLHLVDVRNTRRIIKVVTTVWNAGALP